MMTSDLVNELRGTLIAIPALNPAGLRTRQRNPYYVDGDPNRLFPKPGAAAVIPKHTDKPHPELEIAYQRLFDTILATQPAALLDLHNATIGSIPFTLRDPVFYYPKRGMRPDRAQATGLQAQVGELVDAIGFTRINEYATDSYVVQNLDRSLSGSVLNRGEIPAVTMELGSWMFIDPGVVTACLAGLRNALRWAGMLAGELETIEGIPLINPGYPVRRSDGVYAQHTGIAHHLVRPGEMFSPGQPLARMTDIFGSPLGEDDGLIRAEEDGFVYGWSHGVVRYRGETIMSLAIHDESEMVVPYPG
jgi:hypothetical protein